MDMSNSTPGRDLLCRLSQEVASDERMQNPLLGRSRSGQFRSGRLRVVVRPSISATRSIGRSWFYKTRLRAGRGMVGQHWRGTRFFEFLKWTAACCRRRRRSSGSGAESRSKAVVNSRTSSLSEEACRSSAEVSLVLRSTATQFGRSSCTGWPEKLGGFKVAGGLRIVGGFQVEL